MPEGKSVKLTIHEGFMWGVATETIPPPEPHMEPERKRVLKLSTLDETDIQSWPMSEQVAEQIGNALLGKVAQPGQGADSAPVKL